MHFTGQNLTQALLSSQITSVMPETSVLTLIPNAEFLPEQHGRQFGDVIESEGTESRQRALPILANAGRCQ